MDLIIYVSLALILKGFVVVNRNRIHFTTGEDRAQRQFTSSQSNGNRRDNNSVAISLLFYPAVYIITVSPIAMQVLHNCRHSRQVLPIAAVRWTTFSNPNAYVPFAATAFSDTLFASSGLLNVILFALTRPKVLPSREAMILDTSASSFRPEHMRGKDPGSLADFSRDDSRDWVEIPIRASSSPRDKHNLLAMQFP